MKNVIKIIMRTSVKRLGAAKPGGKAYSLYVRIPAELQKEIKDSYWGVDFDKPLQIERLDIETVDGSKLPGMLVISNIE